MVGLERILAHLRKRWFLLGVVAVIILAKIHPFVGAKGGEDARGEEGGAGPLFPHIFFSFVFIYANSINVFTPTPIQLAVVKWGMTIRPYQIDLMFHGSGRVFFSEN